MGVELKVCQKDDLSKTLYMGLFAGVGKALDGTGWMGMGLSSSPNVSASSCIAIAKSYQDATPESVQ